MIINHEGKIILRVNASSLKESSCMLRWTNTILHGYHSPYGKDANATYGVAVHKYIDTMFKSPGDRRLARDKMYEAFRIPKFLKSKQNQWILDEAHLHTTAFNVWENLVSTDALFDHIEIQGRCWWCDGSGKVGASESDGESCTYCNGTGLRKQPATEVTFSVKYYEDVNVVIYLEGTIDKIGKIRGGCYAIGDYKTTTAWNKDEYLNDYWMSPQLRFYTLALRLMAEQAPDSILGQIGATKTGAFIDGIFLKAKIEDIEYKRSAVMIFSREEMDEFNSLLTRLCARLSDAAKLIQLDKLMPKEGLFNGSCKGEWGKCQYWRACMSGSQYETVMKNDFKKKEYNPLKHNEI